MPRMYRIYNLQSNRVCICVYKCIYRLLSPLRTIYIYIYDVYIYILYIDSNPMVCGGQAIIASINDIEKFKSIRYETCT